MSTKSTSPHLTEDIVELYSMGRLSEVENEKVEEHLLVCHACQDLLTETDEFVAAARTATHELSLQSKPEFETERESEPWWRRLFSIPRPMIAAAAFALMAFFVFVPRQSPMATVELQTLRGPETPAVAPANTPLNLKLSLRGLESTGPLRVEIVDASGQILEKAGAERSDELAIAKAEALASGTYWVRLYSGDELLREYGLNVR
jgi:anti-sigma factor RsiW